MLNRLSLLLVHSRTVCISKPYGTYTGVYINSSLFVPCYSVRSQRILGSSNNNNSTSYGPFRPAAPFVERAQSSVRKSIRADEICVRSPLEYENIKKPALPYDLPSRYSKTNEHSISPSEANLNPPLKEAFLLTPLDNFLPQVTQYARKLLFFPQSSCENAAIIQHMRNAFVKMVGAIPWIAGSVTQIDHEQRGRLSIAAPWRTVDDLLTVNGLNHLDYAELKRENFPTHSLKDEELYPQSKWSKQPTLEAQINFIQGGIILAVRAAHCAIDGRGLLMITKVWAAYCRGEDGSLLLGKDSLDRGRLMNLPPAKLKDFGEYTELPSRKQAPEQGLARTYFKVRELVSTVMKTSLISTLRLASDLITYQSICMAVRPKKALDEGTTQTIIFFFPAARLKELKEAITASVNAEGQPESKAWITTHDGVVSLLWCCITQTWKDSNYCDRDTNPEPLLRLLWQRAFRTTQPFSVLSFFLDGRRLIKDPLLESYFGNSVLMNSLGAPFGDVDSTLKSVSRYAYALRRKIYECDENRLMGVVGALGTVPDVTRIRLQGSPFPESAIWINSWAAMDYYSSDWGREVGGRAERIRGYIILDPCCVVLPRLDVKDGFDEDECGLEVVVTLKSTYMRKLRENELFNRFAQWRCS